MSACARCGTATNNPNAGPGWLCNGCRRCWYCGAPTTNGSTRCRKHHDVDREALNR